MAKKSSTKRNSSQHKPRDDTAFNPFTETQKVLGFSEEAGRVSCEAFTVYVDRGILKWSNKKLHKNSPGFVAVIHRYQLGAGLTNKQWRRLEEKIAKEMCKQRKAW